MEVKTTVTQQVMGKAISFEAEGLGLYNYRVLDTSTSKITLEQTAQRINFKFDGMGKKHSFDSQDTADMAGRYGNSMKNFLSKKLTLVLDKSGIVLMTVPEKAERIKTDERLSIVLNMMGEIPEMVYPPAKGDKSFFAILPGKELKIGDSWTDSSATSNGKIKNTFTLAAVTDTSIIVDIKSNTVTADKAVLMGNETITTMSGMSTGQIILDKKTGIVKEKRIFTESSGSMEAMGGSTPVTSKTYLNVFVISD